MAAQCCCHALCCRKHDLWVLSSHPLFGAPNKAASVSSHHQQQPQQQPPSGAGPLPGRAPGILLVRSLWHGPDRDGRMAVEVLPGSSLQLARQQQVTALLGPDVTTDVQIVEALRGKAWQQQWPLWGPLLHTPTAPAQVAAAAGPPAAHQGHARSVAAAAVVQQFGLNDGQAAVVDHVAEWQQQLARSGGAGGRKPRGRLVLHPSSQMVGSTVAAAPDDGSGAATTISSSSSSSGRPPICLIHGPFGSGKSTLLCALIHLLTGVHIASLPADVPPAAAATAGSGSSKPSMAAPAAAGPVPGPLQEPDCSAVQAGGGRGGCQTAPGSDSDEDSLPVQRRRRQRQDTPQQGTHDSSKRRKLSRLQQGGAAGGEPAPLKEVTIADLLEDSSEEEAGDEEEEDDFQPAVARRSRPVEGSSSEAAQLREEEGPADLAAPQRQPPAEQASMQQPSGLKRRRHVPSSLASAAAAAAGAAATNGVRVLVAAHTNVAVDRVLLGLVEAGFMDVLRVGSLPRIAKPLLQYSLHSADDSKDAVVQLQGMLRDATGQDERLIR